MAIQAQKGTKDILPQDSPSWQFMEEKAKKLFTNANFNEIRTPIFEATELFARGVGSSTDIVNKEMYTFTQKDRSITLRPENTAGVVRAYIENGMHRLPSPVKLWYKGPMFRYERPQAGRQRQFHQLGVELLGIKEASADAEVIELAVRYLNELGISNISLEINSIGCPKCREAHKENIKAVIAPKLSEFCNDCHVRFEKNPLRILDCKNPDCKKLLSRPEIQEVVTSDYICNECVEHFEDLKSYLDALNINYTVSKLLVRGLDYYNRTVFEIACNALGSQNAVCGGGRYDYLVEMLDGQPTPAVGWAMGMERLLTLMPEHTPQGLTAYVVSHDTKEALKLAEELRKSDISCDFDMTGKKFVKQLEKAGKSGAKYAAILGESELESGTVTVKDLSTSEQQTVERNKVSDFYKN